jgi:hypothetical protein
MSDLNTVLGKIRDTIADAAAIKTWAVTNFARYHKVFVGLDSRNPPVEDDYPCISLYPAAKENYQDEDSTKNVFGCSCGVCTEAVATVASTNVTEYSGVQLLEAFRKLVVDAIQGMSAEDGGGYLTGVKVDYAPIEFFPFFLCDMEITIKDFREFGSDYFD